MMGSTTDPTIFQDTYANGFELTHANSTVIPPLSERDGEHHKTLINVSNGYTEHDFSPWEFSWSSQVALVSAYSLMVLVAVCGNVLTLVVLVFGHRSKNDLTVFLGNLAVADALMAISCIPFTFTQSMLGHWIFGNLMCPLVNFVQVTSVTVSVLTNISLGIDRYWAVEHALKPRLNKGKAGIIICILWILSGIVACPKLIYQRSLPHVSNPKYRMCYETWSDRTRKVYTLFLLSVAFIIPLTILAYTYSWVGWRLWRRVIPGQIIVKRQERQLLSKRKVIKMLIAVVVAFAICWLPLHIFTCLLDFSPQLLTTLNLHAFLAIFYVCHWLAMSNCLVNPFIYGYMSGNFRADLKNICRRIAGCACLESNQGNNFPMCGRNGGKHMNDVLVSSKKRWSIRSLMTTYRSTGKSRAGQQMGTQRHKQFEAMPTFDVYPPLDEIKV